MSSSAEAPAVRKKKRAIKPPTEESENKQSPDTGPNQHSFPTDGFSDYKLGDLSVLFSPGLEQDVCSAPLEKVVPAPITPLLLGKNARKKLRKKGMGQQLVIEKKTGDEVIVDKKSAPAKKADPANDSRLPRTVFVGNVPVSLKPKLLLQTFRVYGPVESVRFRSFGQKDPKLSKKASFATKTFHDERTSCNAYVVFKHEEDARKALAHNGQNLEGHTLRVDLASSEKKHDNERSVFVGNLPFNAKENELRAFFESCGPVENVRVVRDQLTGIGRGFGYVLFHDVTSVKSALALDQSLFASRALRVYKATNRPKTQKKQPKREQKQSTKTKPKRSKLGEPRQVKQKKGSTTNWQGETTSAPTSKTVLPRKRKQSQSDSTVHKKASKKPSTAKKPSTKKKHSSKKPKQS